MVTLSNVSSDQGEDGNAKVLYKSVFQKTYCNKMEKKTVSKFENIKLKHRKLKIQQH